MSTENVLPVWQDFAREHQARLDYSDDRTGDGREESIRMHIDYRYWKFELTCLRVTQSTGRPNEQYTRIKTEINNKDHFRFNLYPEKAKHRLYKIMGLQDIIIGDSYLDRRYIIQASDEDKLKKLLSISSVRRVLESKHIQQVGVIDDEKQTPNPLPLHKDILVGRIDTRLTEATQIKAHIDMVSNILDALLDLEFIQQ